MSFGHIFKAKFAELVAPALSWISQDSPEDRPHNYSTCLCYSEVHNTQPSHRKPIPSIRNVSTQPELHYLGYSMPKKRLPSPSAEEKRLLGDFGPPSDGEGVPLLPEMDYPVSSARRTRKPGAPSFYPTNTLHGELALRSVRGDNVLPGQQARIAATPMKRPAPMTEGFRPKKRLKDSLQTRSQLGKYPHDPISLDEAKVIMPNVDGTGKRTPNRKSAEVIEPSPPQPNSRTGSTTSKSGGRWSMAVSNTDEFQNLEDRMRAKPGYSNSSRVGSSYLSSRPPTNHQSARCGQRQSPRTVLPAVEPTSPIDRQVHSTHHKKNYSVPEVEWIGSKSTSTRSARKNSTPHRRIGSHKKSASEPRISDFVEDEDIDELQLLTPKDPSHSKRVTLFENVLEQVKSDELGQVDDDEKHPNGHDIPSSVKTRKAAFTTKKAATSTTYDFSEFYLNEFASTDHISEPPPVLLRHDRNLRGLSLSLHDQDGTERHRIRTDKLTQLNWSPGSPLVFITGTKDTATNQISTANIEFGNSKKASEFAALFSKPGSSIKAVERRPSFNMENAYAAHLQRLRALPVDPVDKGQEMDYLEQCEKRREEEVRLQSDDSVDLIPPKKRGKGGAPPHTGLNKSTGPKKFELLAQEPEQTEARTERMPLRADRRSTNERAHARASNIKVVVEVPVLRSRRAAAQRADSALSATWNGDRFSNRPVTRGQWSTIDEPAPLPVERYSKSHDLGVPWSQAVMYPMTGRGKANVNFEDLERLDDGEFFNDNLVEFGMRWAEKMFPEKPNKVYCFNTHFYTTLTSGRNRRLNYDAVKKWTKDIDIFDYDYILVPVNENLHWYLAIICHAASAFSSTVVIQDSQETSQPEQTSKYFDVVLGPSSDLKDGVKSVLRLSKTEQQEQNQLQPMNEQPEPKLSPLPCDKMKEMSLDDDVIISGSQGDGSRHPFQQPSAKMENPSLDNDIVIPDSQEDMLKHADQQLSHIEISERDQEPSSNGPGASAIVATNTLAIEEPAQITKTASAAASKRKPKRYSTALRKYRADEPIIFILDSMGGTHPSTISNLKDYLIKEAEDKLDRKVSKESFKGANAKAGIPQQDNFYDCGVFVCGYIEKLMSNPDEFGRKLLNQEFDITNDWPDMSPSNMRAKMRTTLQKLAKEQEEERRKTKEERKAAKRAAVSGSLTTETNTPKVSPPVDSRPVTPKPTAPSAIFPTAEVVDPMQAKQSAEMAPTISLLEANKDASARIENLWELHQSPPQIAAASGNVSSNKRKSPSKDDTDNEQPRKKMFTVHQQDSPTFEHVMQPIHQEAKFPALQQPKEAVELIRYEPNQEAVRNPEQVTRVVEHGPMQAALPQSKQIVHVIHDEPRQIGSCQLESEFLYDHYTDAGEQKVTNDPRSPAKLPMQREVITILEDETASPVKTSAKNPFKQSSPSDNNFFVRDLPFGNKKTPNRQTPTLQAHGVDERSSIRYSEHAGRNEPGRLQQAVGDVSSPHIID